jgi:hypothetical protein
MQRMAKGNKKAAKGTRSDPGKLISTRVPAEEKAGYELTAARQDRTLAQVVRMVLREWKAKADQAADA